MCLHIGKISTMDMVFYVNFRKGQYALRCVTVVGASIEHFNDDHIYVLLRSTTMLNTIDVNFDNIYCGQLIFISLGKHV